MCLTFVFFNLLRLHTFIGMHIQKIKYHIFSWPYFKAFLGNNHHILHFETTIFIVCRSHLPLLGHPSSIKCKKSIIHLTSFVKYFFLRIIFYIFTYLVLQFWYVYVYIMLTFAKSSITCIKSGVIHQVVYRYHWYVRLATKFVLTTRQWLWWK